MMMMMIIIIIIVAKADRSGYDCCYCCPSVTVIRILTTPANGTYAAAPPDKGKHNEWVSGIDEME